MPNEILPTTRARRRPRRRRSPRAPPAEAAFSAARLDEIAGASLRTAMKKALKERYGENQKKMAAACLMSVNGMRNIMDGDSNGSLHSATKICAAIKVPLESIVGTNLAEAATALVQKERAKAAQLPKGRPPLPRPSAPILPHAAPAAALTVGAKVPRGSVSTTEMASLRRGVTDVNLLGRLLDEYEDMKAIITKLKDKAFAEWLTAQGS